MCVSDTLTIFRGVGRPRVAEGKASIHGRKNQSGGRASGGGASGPLARRVPEDGKEKGSPLPEWPRCRSWDVCCRYSLP